ncbi:dTDP-glucose 4,6-dehydratase [Streptomyces hiroshimensis]|uniref:dTDP-glucose 4,6-dehydratase n=1 Tax=Streptomyces hiroshimensis TaxID=66424 RepID=A0ABQ2YS49_9ACTN|nr:dTDP-glucose 4,6-dehydratase [Streptomyces hiroshimensis]GGX91817.1 dTDP-glucose 4,6-dehydratase [Streptomyces hiroshimensis]
MKVLVTGGAGFIGSHYVRTMLSGGYRGYEDAHVTVIDKLTYAGNTDNLPMGDPRLTFVRGDVCNQDLLRQLLPGHDAVVHFAAESHVDRSVDGAVAFVHSNVLGTQSVLDACLYTGVDNVVHVSTDEVYGSIATGTWTEESPLLPNSPYSASKAGSDLLARAYHRTHKLNVRITRCSNNYGTHQHVEKLIPQFVTRLLQGQQVPLYGEGTNIREWLHVDDHCRAIQLVLTAGRAGETYNIGGATALTNREMTERLLDLTGHDWSQVQHVPDRKGHDFRYAINDDKIRAELGYAPHWTLDEGLKRVVGWYVDHPEWWKPLLDD